MVGNLSGIPIRLYDGDMLMYKLSIMALPKDPFHLVKAEVTAVDKHVGFFAIFAVPCNDLLHKPGTHQQVDAACFNDFHCMFSRPGEISLLTPSRQ